MESRKRIFLVENLCADIHHGYVCTHMHRQRPKLRIMAKNLLDPLIQLPKHIQMSNSLPRLLY